MIIAFHCSPLLELTCVLLKYPFSVLFSDRSIEGTTHTVGFRSHTASGLTAEAVSMSRSSSRGRLLVPLRELTVFWCRIHGWVGNSGSVFSSQTVASKAAHTQLGSARTQVITYILMTVVPSRMLIVYLYWNVCSHHAFQFSTSTGFCVAAAGLATETSTNKKTEHQGTPTGAGMFSCSTSCGTSCGTIDPKCMC